MQINEFSGGFSDIFTHRIRDLLAHVVKPFHIIGLKILMLSLLYCRHGCRTHEFRVLYNINR